MSRLLPSLFLPCPAVPPPPYARRAVVLARSSGPISLPYPYPHRRTDLMAVVQDGGDWWSLKVCGQACPVAGASSSGGEPQHGDKVVGTFDGLTRASRSARSASSRKVP